MSSPEKISVYNLADLKNTSDDALPNYINSLKFRQIHTLSDTRLALGYAAFAIAAACFAWDYKFGFEGTKYYTAAAVALYAAINGVLTYWISYVENGIVYQGESADGTKISIATSTEKNVPTYHVKVTLSKKGSPNQTIDISRPFSEWFDGQGRFIAAPFQTMFATSVPVIGKADPKRVAAAAAASSESQFAGDPDVLDAILAASSGAEPQATGADPAVATASGKKSKRRKA